MASSMERNHAIYIQHHTQYYYNEGLQRHTSLWAVQLLTFNEGELPLFVTEQSNYYQIQVSLSMALWLPFQS